MTYEEVYTYLMHFSWKIGTTAMEEMNQKDGERFREAVQTLYLNADCSAMGNER